MSPSTIPTTAIPRRARISPAMAVVSSPTVRATAAPPAASKASSAQWSMNAAPSPRFSPILGLTVLRLMEPLRMIAFSRSTRCSFSRPCIFGSAPFRSIIFPPLALISTSAPIARPMTVPLTDISSPGITPVIMRRTVSPWIRVQSLGLGRSRSSPRSAASLAATARPSSLMSSESEAKWLRVRSATNLPPQSIWIRGLSIPASFATIVPKARPVSRHLAWLRMMTISESSAISRMEMLGRLLVLMVMIPSRSASMTATLPMVPPRTAFTLPICFR